MRTVRPPPMMALLEGAACGSVIVVHRQLMKWDREQKIVRTVRETQEIDEFSSPNVNG